MKFLFSLAGLFIALNIYAQDSYSPTAENIRARQEFQDMKYGMFIHWGPSSLLGDGEWVMNTRNIHVREYTNLRNFFYPHNFNAAKWVSLAKSAGMKYITFITRHHDGFSNWDTKASDWNVMNTPYKKDIVKMLADECHKQGIKLAFYYSILDWYRDDYPRETGRTGQGTGRTSRGDYASYLNFMKQQLIELLTNYGPVSGIWFDGHWDQTAPEGAEDRSSRLDWKYDEIYGLIHKLQPQCLIGNNHHLNPLPGEDFQMFERDLPGENKSGLSFQKATDKLPIETCETLNGSWGFNITDRNFKSKKEVVHYLVNAAGRNANLLLNIGPMPDGSVQQQFIDTLTAAGQWLEKYGESIYGTRGNVVPPQPWGVVTAKDRSLYVHLLKPSASPFIFVPGIKEKITKAVMLSDGSEVKFKQMPEGIFLYPGKLPAEELDTIIRLTTR